MKILTPAQVVQRVNAWQSAGFVHQLTCGKDSSHAPLKPETRPGEVILKCPDCDYVQENIPDIVLETTPADIQKTKADLEKKGFTFK